MSLTDDIRLAMTNLPPAPRFDRIAVHDLRPFSSIKRLSEAEGLWGDSFQQMQTMCRMTGIPIFVDESVETGVIELRNGDTLVDRILLSELRA